MNQQKSFSHFGRGCHLISADAQELTPSKISQLFFYVISLNLQVFPETNKFCNKSETPNKIPLIILSKKHAHCEQFPSLPFLLFNKSKWNATFWVVPVETIREQRNICKGSPVFGRNIPKGNSCSISSKPSLTPVSVRGFFAVNGTDFYK